MSTNHNYGRLSILITLLVLNYSCFCIARESNNATISPMSSPRPNVIYYPAVATWYGSPTGAGSGGACGLADDVSNDPYFGFISAGNNNLFKAGAGCGTCYELVNATLDENGFLPAVATWYGSPTGAGSGGACGLADDVINYPYLGMISAANNNIFRSGAGCGTCYMVKCIDNPACSGNPIIVTITDECPGLCNNDPFHFDLSGKAFGSLAKSGQEDVLRNTGRINIQYSSVECHYKSHIALKIDTGSNPYYLAFAVENVNGDGEIARIDILPLGWKYWVPMQRSWGETWKFDVANGASGPYSIRFTDRSSRSVMAHKVIPGNWEPGRTYYSRINFP